jgi:coenzyme F420 hydrogenase subunit beta
MKKDESVGQTVIETVVKRELCVGCGICAGLCPFKNLKMIFNHYGEYTPTYTRDKCEKRCNICLEVCPFSSSKYNEYSIARERYGQEEEVNYQPETGYFLKSYAGHVENKERRLESASGGLATWFLNELLKQKIVDRVICVTPEDSIGKLFKFISTDNIETVYASSKSCYYPVELSSILKEIKDSEFKYAIIGLPCFIKGLRLAMMQIPSLNDHIRLLVGLVCGHAVSRFFAEYLCALAGGDPDSLKRARFRIKDSERAANDFGFRFECAKGQLRDGLIYWSEGMGDAWSRGYFKLNACDYCDDIFAELADIVFMDAWLDGYIQDPRGNNLVVVRTKQAERILNTGVKEGNIYLETVPIEHVKKSQEAVISLKREELAKRLFIKATSDGEVIKKRVEPASTRFLEMLQIRIRKKVTDKSKRQFSKRKRRKEISRFQRELFLLEFALRVVNHLVYRFEAKAQN